MRQHVAESFAHFFKKSSGQDLTGILILVWNLVRWNLEGQKALQ